MERNPFQHPFVGDVGEPHIPELDLTPDLVQLDGIGRVHDPGFNVHDGEHLLRGREGGLQPVELLRQVLDGTIELGDEHIEGDHRAGGEGLPQEGYLVDVALAAQIQQAQHGADVQHVHQRPEDAEYQNFLLLRPAQSVALAPEILHLPVLPVENLGDLDAGEIF